MKKTTLPLVLILFLCPSAARAQVNVGIDIGLPPIPRLVVVQPGIQVVEGFQEEVFFNHGWYWCRRPNGWYRSRSPRAHFDMVEEHRVPRALVRMPSGHYRNWHREEARHQERREMRQERREVGRERREDRRERREVGRERREIGHDRAVERRKEGDHRERGGHQEEGNRRQDH